MVYNFCQDSTSTVSSTSTTQSLASSVTKPRFSLPFFCIYISWFLSWSLIVLSAFFLWAYGVAYGNDFISKWFISFVLSFFTSFFVFEPLKVRHQNILFMTKILFCKVLIFVMISSLFCHHDLDTDFDDSFDDEEAFVNEDDDSWYDNDKLVKTKVYR